MNFDYEQAYRMMYLIRYTEESIRERYHRDSKMRCPTHLSVGQESAAVGVAMALKPQDRVWAYHRCHSHYLAKGANLDAMIAELYGKQTGCSGGWGGSMHLVDESVGFHEGSTAVGDGASIAIGAAMASKLEGSDRVVAALIGDSAVETGQFWESANFAALHKLPIMFVCENNQYSTAAHISERQPPTPITDRVKGFMWTASVDDGDIESVWQAANECRESRPGFLEISTYRFWEHVGPNYDWDLGYRTEEEVLSHIAKDPLPQVRDKLEDSVAQIIEIKVQQRVRAAFDNAEAAPWPEAFSK